MFKRNEKMTDSRKNCKSTLKECIPLSLEDLNGSNQSKLVLKLNAEEQSELSIEENAEIRQNWGSRLEFLLACVGYSVGLGNVWRFGYLCSKSGGGAFLIPYFITLLIVAVPLMFMEFSVGQFTQRGPIGAMSRLCPLFKGTGIATVVISFFLTTYYIVIIAWDLYFLFASFGSEVQWKTCNNSWNTKDCWDGSLNSTFKLTNDSKSPSEEFFRRKILNESATMEDFGTPKLDLVLLTLLAWVIVYFCIWKGVKSTGKVVYVTAIFPYLVLIVMLVRGVTLDGSIDGLKYFLIPKWEDLAKPSVWANAAIQNFNSIGVAFGGLISMSSYNKRDKKIFGDVVTIATIDAFTSIICGSTVFSVLGYIAKTQSKTIDDVVTAGPGLIFMVLPEAIRNMSISPLWGILFFSMVFLLGIDSQFTMVETVITTLEDEFEVKIKKYLKKREILVLVVCIVTFFLTLPNVCPGGIFYFTILDFFSAGISVFYIAFFEIMAIVWIYGAKRLAKNIFLMTGRKPNIYFLVCWYAITPGFIIIIWAFNWYHYEPISYGKYQFSLGAQLFGWSIALVSIVSIPLGALHTLLKAPGKTIKEKILVSLKPTILDIDQEPNKVVLNKTVNRAKIFKNNKTEPEVIAF